jgi:hypothetical protein
MDDVLLEIHNQKEGGYAWSLVATTSHILALGLSLLQDLMNVSLFLVCCKFSFDSPKYCLYVIHFQPNVLLGLHLSSRPIIVAP